MCLCVCAHATCHIWAFYEIDIFIRRTGVKVQGIFRVSSSVAESRAFLSKLSSASHQVESGSAIDKQPKLTREKDKSIPRTTPCLHVQEFAFSNIGTSSLVAHCSELELSIVDLVLYRVYLAQGDAGEGQRNEWPFSFFPFFFSKKKKIIYFRGGSKKEER